MDSHRPPKQRSDEFSPSQNLRTIISIWLAFHLLAIAISFTSVVEPSSVHARLSELVHPYLRPTHFSADDRPVYLAHGDAYEQPHQVQVSSDALRGWDSMDQLNWQVAGPRGTPGLAVSDRVARWLATAAMLSENDQPSLAAELLLPLAMQNPSIRAIRIVRLPTDLGDVNDVGETPYVADIVRDGEEVSLVELQSTRLSSLALPPESTSNEEGAGDE